MKSALAIVAFRHATHRQGITALLETALRALDESGDHLVAAHVSMALARMLAAKRAEEVMAVLSGAEANS